MKTEQPRFYRRNLPHIQPENGVFFVTYNLNGALPKAARERLKAERDLKINELSAINLPQNERRHAIRAEREFYFEKFDELLDNPTIGHKHLARKEVANMVIESLHWLNERSYKLVAFIVMANHVHKIVYNTKEPLWVIMKNHKSFTAREANKIIGLSGQFWQHESFDHLIRNRDSFIQKIRYTLNNAVAAGFVDHWKDYQYAWIRPEYEKYAPK